MKLDTTNIRLPGNLPPVIGTWFWWEKEFEAQGYRAFIDHAAKHSPFNILTTSIRAPKELTDPAVIEHIRQAAVYARERGIGLAMDLDARLARSSFMEKYPNELQEMLRITEIKLHSTQRTKVSINPISLEDHYTVDNTPYVAMSGSLIRVYSYIKGSSGIKAGSVCDITDNCEIEEESQLCVSVSLPESESEKEVAACVMAAFAHFTPDVFAPHLLEFQRDILDMYKHIPLAGACKDEWGFPPCFNGWPEKNNFWFSRYRAEAYHKITGGRDLVRDCLLMYAGEEGRQGEREMAINQFMQMAWQRNGEIEADFYDAVKQTWGPSALVCTHPTWWPVPDSHEIMKNGLHWWVAKRDYAQTDEITPHCVRTALAKKWGSPLWYNMFYSSNKYDYARELWSNCLAGGRVNYHPVFPLPDGISPDSEQVDILQGRLMRAESRIRMLNFITKAPLDCPVAVVFGHACAMNWAGPGYDDVGLKLAEELWKAGYPADLIPTDEIDSGSLKLGEDGCVRYGAQAYSTLIIYHPEYQGNSLADFINRASTGKTKLFYNGFWTKDFSGNRFDASRALSGLQALPDDLTEAARMVADYQRSAGVEQQTPSVDTQNAVWFKYAAPPVKGHCRLLDGTHVFVSAENDPEGDPIIETISIGGHQIDIDTIGLSAVKLDADGNVLAVAAGGLKLLSGGGLDIRLEDRVDIALWKDEQDNMHAAIQGLYGEIPDSLAEITTDWTILSLPEV
ncbi:MAG: hypothetical protein ABFD83_12510 [Armatimonadota bacterium]